MFCLCKKLKNNGLRKIKKMIVLNCRKDEKSLYLCCLKFCQSESVGLCFFVTM